jgi:hypothetical protein
MLAFLEDLIAALVAHDAARLAVLRRSPLLSALPADVRGEVIRVMSGVGGVPLLTMRYRHTLAHLLGAVGNPAEHGAADPLRPIVDPFVARARPVTTSSSVTTRRRRTTASQIELALPPSPRRRASA